MERHLESAGDGGRPILAKRKGRSHIALVAATAVAVVLGGSMNFAEARKPKTRSGLLTASSPPEDPNIKLARELYEMGSKLYAEGNYTEALTMFTSAYDKAPKNTLLYNIARCYHRLGNLNDAIKSLKRYLAGLETGKNDYEAGVLLANWERERSQNPDVTTPSTTPPPVLAPAEAVSGKPREPRSEVDSVTPPAPVNVAATKPHRSVGVDSELAFGGGVDFSLADGTPSGYIDATAGVLFGSRESRNRFGFGGLYRLGFEEALGRVGKQETFSVPVKRQYFFGVLKYARTLFDRGKISLKLAVDGLFGGHTTSTETTPAGDIGGDSGIAFGAEAGLVLDARLVHTHNFKLGAMVAGGGSATGAVVPELHGDVIEGAAGVNAKIGLAGEF